jgi:hypothetical protein
MEEITEEFKKKVCEACNSDKEYCDGCDFEIKGS